MPISSYPPELMAIFRAYAASLGPTPEPEYNILHHWHPWIQVPPGYLPIRIAQFYRGNQSTGEKKPYHWVIFIPTSTTRGMGNYYEIGGSLQDGYFTQHVHSRHVKWDKDEKGTHLVGYVAPSYLETLKTHFSLVPIQQGGPDWTSQIWVVDALKGLNHAQMYAVQMDHSKWVEQMEILEAAWEVGDA
ncbi:hypothetical protein J3R82DRAFT_11013 [Butyriboletus roseoflavus]|nr:hypothetical protein J3R82DRAFT_11013 [Butyriboletus roseoflavus]